MTERRDSIVCPAGVKRAPIASRSRAALGARMLSALAVVSTMTAGCGATISNGPADADLAPVPAAAPIRSNSPDDEVPSPLGRDWIFVKVEGYDGPLPSPPPVAGFIMTREGQRLTGTTACNRLGSGYEIDVHTGSLRFLSLRNTRMLCDRVASDTEEAVLAAMIATDSYRLDGTRLELLSKGRVVAVLVTND